MPHRTTMSSPVATTAQLADNGTRVLQSVNTDSILPTNIQLRRAYTLPSLGLHSYNNQSIRLVLLPEPGVKRWFTYVVGMFTIVGLVVSVIAVVIK